MQGRQFRCKDGEVGISLFLREREVARDEDLHGFQRAYPLRSGDLPAVWPVGTDDLEQCGLAFKPVLTEQP